MSEYIEEKCQIEMIAMIMVFMVLGFVWFCWDFVVDLLGVEAIDASWERRFLFI